MEQLTKEDISALQQLHFSLQEIAVYEVLVSAEQSQTAQQVASQLGILPNAVYRIFARLEGVGMAQRRPGYPRRYQAFPKQPAIEAVWQTMRVDMDSRLAGSTAENQIIIGRQAVYQKYIELAAMAQKSISIYAIGIAYSEALRQAQAQALERGVRIRHVVQQLQPDNFYVIRKWQRLGIRIRHLKNARGFHVTIIDDTTALVTFSNPGDTEERLSMLTNNPAAVKLFKVLFEQIWHEAKEITI